MGQHAQGGSLERGTKQARPAPRGDQDALRFASPQDIRRFADFGRFESSVYAPHIVVRDFIALFAVGRSGWNHKTIHYLEIFERVLGHRHVWEVVEVLLKQTALNVISFGDQ